MERSSSPSQEVVRAIQDSFLMRAVCIQPIFPDLLLQAANSRRRDIFQIFFETLAEQKADLEPHKSYLTRKVPPHYQQDLEQASISAGAVAIEKSTPASKGKQVPGTVHARHIYIHTCILL